MFASMRESTGIQTACEVQYTMVLDDGTTVPVAGVARVRKFSGCKDERFLVLDLKKRYRNCLFSSSPP